MFPECIIMHALCKSYANYAKIMLIMQVSENYANYAFPTLLMIQVVWPGGGCPQLAESRVTA